MASSTRNYSWFVSGNGCGSGGFLTLQCDADSSQFGRSCGVGWLCRSSGRGGTSDELSTSTSRDASRSHECPSIAVRYSSAVESVMPLDHEAQAYASSRGSAPALRTPVAISIFLHTLETFAVFPWETGLGPISVAGVPREESNFLMMTESNSTGSGRARVWVGLCAFLNGGLWCLESSF